MKNVLLFIALFVCTAGAMAQTEKGKFRLGGDVDLSGTTVKFDGYDDESYRFNLNANAGYFVINNLAIEAGVGFNYEKEEDADDGESALVFEVGARYYLPFKLFFGASFDIMALDYYGNSSSGTGVNMKVGYAWFIKDNIAFEPAIGYRQGLSSKDEGTKYDKLSVQFGLSVYF